MKGPGRARRIEAGFTLVELMVTIAVASAVAVGTFVFFAGQQRIYDTQAQLLGVQQNLWLAMEVLTRQVRSAGTGTVGCGAQGLRAYRNGTGMVRLPPLTVGNGAAGASDQLTLISFGNASGNFVDGTLMDPVPMTFAGAAIRSTESELFRDGEFIMLLDRTATPPGGDRGCSLFRITGDPGTSDSISVAPGSDWNAPANVPGLIPYNYAPASAGIRNLGTLTWVRYFIDATGRAPRLMVDDLTDSAPAQMLAEGIEDVQVAFACDFLPAAAPDGAFVEGTDAASRLADEWINNQAGDVVPVACATPAAVRITLIARSLSPDTSLTGSSGSGSVSASAKPAAEDGAAGAPDTFRHRVLTTTIYPRN